MQNEKNVLKKENNINTFEDIVKSSTTLSQDISNFLSNEIEELNVNSHIFKNGLERCFNRVLSNLYKQSSPVAIFPDSVPGFTLLAFKKNKTSNTEVSNDNKLNPLEKNEEKILNNVLNKFFNKNQQMIMVIEHNDILFVLFPVEDARKNLKEMQLYITF